MKAQTELIPKRLDRKIAVVTGGSSGIGLATARRFVQEGAYAFIFGRGQSEVELKKIEKNKLVLTDRSVNCHLRR